jgi:radical SAM protein with 4Fe4S-binding SPASM domain
MSITGKAERLHGKDGRPYIYEVEPTNACPYSCIMCPRGQGKMKRPVGFMPLHTFERVLGQISPSQKMLRLHHFGEPVLHPELPSMIRMTRDAGLVPLISVNPATLTEGLIERLIESGIGITVFSFDSLQSERLYEIRGIRKSADYCMEMIDTFISLSRESPAPIFKVIQMVSLTVNKDERQAFLSLKERYPGEDVYLYISGNFGFGDVELVRETCRGEDARLLADRFLCRAPFDDIVVLWNGDIVLCCYDYDGYNVIGNVNEASVEDIWSSGKASRLRQRFLERETKDLPLCGKCYAAPHTDARSVLLHGTVRGYLEEGYILGLFPPFRRYIE